MHSLLGNDIRFIYFQTVPAKGHDYSAIIHYGISRNCNRYTNRSSKDTDILNCLANKENISRELMIKTVSELIFLYN